ncbi:hypothetical protein BVC80_521g84 [Macleaya cordata]|uniref:Uncharacterized protein n=1 Tax=Macleaya cordata TaxID=56857 RepID=A0A200R9A0_MACCD|nr:hypothetical protein BVC80_521g84 [Macleaya cordata]
MGWAACETYWSALTDITCFMWHKLKNTKRVYRRRHRFRDVEVGYSSSEDSMEKYRSLSVSRRRRSIRERRKDRVRRSLYPVKLRSKVRYRSRSRHHHDVQWKTSEVSVRVKGGSGRIRNSRQLQVRKAGNFGRQVKLFKRRKIR